MPEDELPVGLRHLEIKVHLRFCGEEAVGTHRRKQIHEEVVDAPVARVNKLRHILKHVVYGFYDTPFT